MILCEPEVPFFDRYDIWWNPLRVREENYIQTVGSGTILHELGHNMNFPTLPGELETVVQLVSVPAYAIGLEVPLDSALSYVEGEKHTSGMAAINWMIAVNFRNNEPMGCDPTIEGSACSEKRYQIRAGMKYFDIASLFGWHAPGAIHGVYYHRFKNADWFVDNVPFISSEDYINTATEAVNINLTPLLHFWGYIPGEAQKQALDAYPPGPEILRELVYYQSIVPKSRDEFLLWCDRLRPTVDPVHYDRYDWTLENYDTQNNSISSIADVLQNQLEVLPNPASDVLMIRPDENDPLQFIELYDIHSRKIRSTTVLPANTLDISMVPPGLYFLRSYGKKRQYLNKVIVER